MKRCEHILHGHPPAQLRAQHKFRRLLGRSTTRTAFYFLEARRAMTIVLMLVLAVSLALPAYAQEALWKDLRVKVRTLYHQGRYTEATKVAQEALKVAENTFGPDHPNLATSLNNLAELYRRLQGKYAAAEPLYQRALGIREKALGPSHPQVATSLNNLAELYYTQGKYAAAEPLYKRALAIWEKALGPDHPQVATVLKNMARLYKEAGRVDEAIRWEKRANAIRSRNQ